MLIRFWWSGLLALAPGSKALSGDTVEVNVISRVEVRGSAVEIAGNRKPNFTTFTMTDPPRLVVDISEAVFSQVPEEIRVQNGTIRAIKTAGYGSGSSAIARVIIGFERNVETDIANLGEHSLLVKILGEGSPAVAETEKPAASPRAVAGRSATPSTVVLPSAVDQAVKAPEKPKEVPAVAQKPEQKKLEVAQVNQQAERERLQREQEEKEAKRREAEAKRAAELKAQEEARQKRLAEIEEKKRLENEARIAEAEAKEERLRLAAEEKQKKEEQARLAKELEREQAKAEEERRKQAAAAEKQKKLEEARLAKQIEAQERAKEEERRRQADAEKQSKQEAALLARRLEQERAVAENDRPITVKVAKASSRRSDAAEVPQMRRRPTGHSVVTFVGFTHEASGSRVFVRTTAPVQYSVAEGKDKTVILELENARIGLRNNTRPLDTSHFDSAVAMVEPNQAAAEIVRVQIRLKDSVPYRAKQEGNEVVLDFGPPTHP